MNLGFWFGLVLLVLFFGLTTFALHQHRKAIVNDESLKHKDRQAEAKQADRDRANDIAKKANAAASRDIDKPLAERLRDSGRGRTPKNGTN